MLWRWEQQSPELQLCHNQSREGRSLWQQYRRPRLKTHPLCQPHVLLLSQPRDNGDQSERVSSIFHALYLLYSVLLSRRRNLGRGGVSRWSSHLHILPPTEPLTPCSLESPRAVCPKEGVAALVTRTQASLRLTKAALF